MKVKGSWNICRYLLLSKVNRYITYRGLALLCVSLGSSPYNFRLFVLDSGLPVREIDFSGLKLCGWEIRSARKLLRRLGINILEDAQ